MWCSAPNALSILRIFFSVALIAVYSGNDAIRYCMGLTLIGLCIATDILDGYIARRFKLTSELGYILDGLGDRAAYIALILTFVAHNGVNLLIAWLLTFREIVIYALRLLRQDWYEANKRTRRYSRLHAVGIRAWFLTYLMSDALHLIFRIDIAHDLSVIVAQTALALGTITISYYGLYRIFEESSRRRPARQRSQKFL